MVGRARRRQRFDPRGNGYVCCGIPRLLPARFHPVDAGELTVQPFAHITVSCPARVPAPRSPRTAAGHLAGLVVELRPARLWCPPLGSPMLQPFRQQLQVGSSSGRTRPGRVGRRLPRPMASSVRWAMTGDPASVWHAAMAGEEPRGRGRGRRRGQFQTMLISCSRPCTGTPEGIRHGDVAQVDGRADAGDVLLRTDAGAFGEKVVQVAVAAVRGQDPGVGDDRVDAVVCRDDESDWFSMRQRCDPPPVSWAGVVRGFVLVVLGSRCCGGAGRRRARHRRVESGPPLRWRGRSDLADKFLTRPCA